MQSDGGQWKSTFVLVKPFLATYHESGKSHKKGFINLKLARVESSSKSGKRFKVRVRAHTHVHLLLTMTTTRS